jgi:alpha,alpha-trehalase
MSSLCEPSNRRPGANEVLRAGVGLPEQEIAALLHLSPKTVMHYAPAAIAALYSKLMCWVALDRAVALADRLDASSRVEAWTQTQNQISEAILARGWSDRANAFTQSFGSDDLDASNLMLPLVGFLPADEPRVLATMTATEERLTDKRGLLYRYRSHDGLEGDEGTFLL